MFRFRGVLRAARLVLYRRQQWSVTVGAVGLAAAASLALPDLRERFIAYSKSVDIPNIDPDTSVDFPKSLNLGSQLSLVGLGVRTVSFLRVKVYSAAFYIEERVLSNINSLDGFSDFSSSQLQDESLVASLLRNADCAIRIVPVRSTDLAHLRDGWVRAIQARQKKARKEQQLVPEQDEEVTKAVQTLKAMFPARAVPKGSAVILARRKDGQLTVHMDGEVLGSMDDEWLSRELFAAYFANDTVISPKLKSSVAEGLERLAKA